MGGCLGVELHYNCDDTVRIISNCLWGEKNFVFKLQDHVTSLESNLEQLKARRVDTLATLREEENPGLKRRRAEVKLWLENVAAIVGRAEEKLQHAEAEIQKLCIFGCCTNKYCSSYIYGKEIWSISREVQNLYDQREKFTVLTQTYVLTKVKEISIDTTISRIKVESTWKLLMEDRVGCLGLYGVPGVGKTTLLTQINNEFTNENDFEVVILAEVPKHEQIESIQEKIRRRLEICDDEWEHLSKTDKGFKINRVLTNRRYALLLDNMLVNMDVKKLGVPLPNRENRSKIVFTTRSKEVSLDIPVEYKEVTCLDDKDAWDLFRGQLKYDMLRGDPSIIEFAEMICRKCWGLPVVINAIAQTMAHKKTFKEWQAATESLSSIMTELPKEHSSLAEFSSKEEDVMIAILKFSYDNLEDLDIKNCFRYYALFPENHEMRKDEVLEYWECGRVTVRGHHVFNVLVGACLLMEHEGKVKMHDMVRQMALRAEPTGSVLVKTDMKLMQIPDDEEWKVLKEMSLINNQIKMLSGSPSCPNLETLLLSNQKLENISTDFFLQMSSLLVLDLSHNRSLTRLPDNISKLVSLRYLDLSSTSIELLPVGLKELTKLICLNLEHTDRLQDIVGISAFQMLNVLRLLGSRFRPTVNFIEELKGLEDINVLTICLYDEATLKSFFDCQLASRTQALCVKDVSTKADGISVVATSTSLQYLEISDSNIHLLPRQRIPINEHFNKLYEVKLYGCKGVKDLTWLLFAPSVVYLHVVRAKDIEEILSKETAEGWKVQAGITPFQNLKLVVFESLEELTSIYWSTLPFKCLSKIVVRQCPKLKKLPLNSESAKGRKVVIDTDFEWIDKLQWEDELTRYRFSQTK